MKITALETFIIPPRWCFLKITTDEGLVGWGEPVLEGRAHSVAATVAELTDYLVGEDPLQIERHWQTLYRGGFYRGGGIHMSAIAGIDQALWDIMGKYHVTPVHQRWRPSARPYSRYAKRWRPPLGYCEQCPTGRRRVQSHKMNLTEGQIIDSISKIDAAVERIARLRGNDSALISPWTSMAVGMSLWLKPSFTPSSLIPHCLSKSQC